MDNSLFDNINRNLLLPPPERRGGGDVAATSMLNEGLFTNALATTALVGGALLGGCDSNVPSAATVNKGSDYKTDVKKIDTDKKVALGTHVDMDKIIQIESSGNPKAVNRRTKARGLCQIMKPTWKEVVRELGETWSWSDAFDADKNREVGNYYMNTMIPRMLKYYGIGDSYEKRLVAYNWGIGNLVKLYKSNPENWGSLVPEETKTYLTKYKGMKESIKEDKTVDVIKGIKASGKDSAYWREIELVPTDIMLKYREFDRAAHSHKGAEYLEELKADIAQNGINDAIILEVDLKGNAKVIEGNHRLAIAKQLGIKYVPVRIVRGSYGVTQQGNGLPINKIKIADTAYYKRNDYDIKYGVPLQLKASMSPSELGLPVLESIKEAKAQPFELLTRGGNGHLTILGDGVKYLYSNATPKMANDLLKMISHKQYGRGWQYIKKNLTLIAKCEVGSSNDWKRV